jgi:hypothetical protein
MITPFGDFSLIPSGIRSFLICAFKYEVAGTSPAMTR